MDFSFKKFEDTRINRRFKMAEEELVERQSSIEVSRNAKNEYSFKAKIYYDEEKRTPTDVIDSLKGVYDYLLKNFK